MKLTKLIAVALAAAFLAASAPATAQNKALFPGKSHLQKENQKLRHELDSLKLELEKMRTEISYADSLASGMLDSYTGVQDSSAVVIAPEDYTPEVSDSLLSIWYLHNKVNQSEEDYYDMDSVKFESNVPDSIYIARIKQMNSFITLPYSILRRCPRPWERSWVFANTTCLCLRKYSVCMTCHSS